MLQNNKHGACECVCVCVCVREREREREREKETKRFLLLDCAKLSWLVWKMYWCCGEKSRVFVFVHNKTQHIPHIKGGEGKKGTCMLRLPLFSPRLPLC